MAIEPIVKCLTISGITLSFDQFEILGIPGFNTSVLYKGEVSLYEVEKQNFSFQVSTLDCLNKTITIDDTFFMKNSDYQYNFKLDREPVHDLTGWSKLNCNLLSIELVC